jgi:purine-binding chemotaxis protein CheW
MADRPDTTAPAPDPSARSGLVERLHRLEAELARAHGELAALGGQALPGLHLIIEAAGRRALLSGSRVQEIVRLVATEPLPGAAEHVLGTFVCRGVPVLAVDLAALLGVHRAPPLDAQITILTGEPVVGLVVDRVHGLVDSPLLHRSGGTAPGWEGSWLVAGLCLHGDGVLPLLDPAPILAMVRETIR